MAAINILIRHGGQIVSCHSRDIRKFRSGKIDDNDWAAQETIPVVRNDEEKCIEQESANIFVKADYLKAEINIKVENLRVSNEKSQNEDKQHKDESTCLINAESSTKRVHLSCVVSDRTTNAPLYSKGIDFQIPVLPEDSEMSSRKRTADYMAFKDSHIKRVYSMKMQSPPMTPSSFLRAVKKFRDVGFIVTECDSCIPRPNHHTATSSNNQTSVPPFYSDNDSSDNSDDYFEVIETSSSDSRTTTQQDNAQDFGTEQQRERQNNQTPFNSIKTESRVEEQSHQPTNTQATPDNTISHSPDTSSRNSRPQRITRPPDFFGTSVPSSLRGMLGVCSTTNDVRDAVPSGPTKSEQTAH